MTKWARIINGVVDVISYDPDRIWVEPVSDLQPDPDNEGEIIEVLIEPGHWNGVTDEWVEVPDDVFGGYIQNSDGSFSPPPPEPPPTEYTLLAFVPWNRMTEEEAELVQDGIDSAPVKTRNMINKATIFTTGTDAFVRFKAIIVAALDQARADEIMGPPLPSEMSAIETE